MDRIQDPEVRTLAKKSSCLAAEYPELEDDQWNKSPFNWIRCLPPRTKGAIGERLVADYLACKGFDVTRSPDGQADRIIAGHRAEIKMSMLWKNGTYKFQQIRDQNYEFAIFLGISPFDAHCWVLPKADIIDRIKTEDIPHQHGGRDGTDTAWLTINPNDVQAWLSAFGGRLECVVGLIAKITGQKP
ncbi:MAG: hypothetical protein GDA53_09765 [Rhodobacteraceae bacterium]|nr:hypothetical protein [Paracoccaceae bacterium]